MTLALYVLSEACMLPYPFRSSCLQRNSRLSSITTYFGSNHSMNRIIEVLALLLENHATFIDTHLRVVILAALQDRAQYLKHEEEQRLDQVRRTFLDYQCVLKAPSTL